MDRLVVIGKVLESGKLDFVNKKESLSPSRNLAVTTFSELLIILSANVKLISLNNAIEVLSSAI